MLLEKQFIILTVISLSLIIGCSNRSTSTRVGFGIVFQVNPDEETRRRNALSTWYTSSSTSSTTIDKEEFISNITKEFLQKRYERIAEESARGEGGHLNALAQLMGKSPNQYLRFATALHNNYKNIFNKQAPSELPRKLRVLSKKTIPTLSSYP